MEALRLFTAVQPDGIARNAIAAARDTLASTLPGRFVRWVAPENYHVTLEFLGDVENSRVDVLLAAMESTVRSSGTEDSGPIALCASGFGAFPSAARARTVWIGITDASGRLAKLETALRRELRAHAITFDEKRFRAHLTLGHIRRATAEEARALASAIASHRPHAALAPPPDAPKSIARDPDARIEFAVSEVLLVRSTLGPGGSRYEAIGSVGLSSR